MESLTEDKRPCLQNLSPEIMDEIKEYLPPTPITSLEQLEVLLGTTPHPRKLFIDFSMILDLKEFLDVLILSQRTIRRMVTGNLSKSEYRQLLLVKVEQHDMEVNMDLFDDVQLLANGITTMETNGLERLNITLMAGCAAGFGVNLGAICHLKSVQWIRYLVGDYVDDPWYSTPETTNIRYLDVHIHRRDWERKCLGLPNFLKKANQLVNLSLHLTVRPKTAVALANALVGNKKLEVLRWNVRCGCQATCIPILAVSLGAVVSRLSTFELSGWASSETVGEIFDGLCGNTNIKNLKLTSVKMDDVSSESLGNLLTTTTSMKKFAMMYHDDWCISPSWVTGLINNQSLQHIYMNLVHVDDTKGLSRKYGQKLHFVESTWGDGQAESPLRLWKGTLLGDESDKWYV